jgi:hypothetical protein
MLGILTFVVTVVGVIGALFSLGQSYHARLRQFEKYVQALLRRPCRVTYETS